MPAEPPSRPRHRPRLLLYAMYDPSGLNSAPKVRIACMGAAIEGLAELERVQGGRSERARAGLRWLRDGGLGRTDAVYVESSTFSATPFDLWFLLWIRLRGRPIGIYFRDAYQLHRDLFPIQRRRQLLADLAWRITMPALRRLATTRFAPSAGLAHVLGLHDAVALPPGTDPSLPNLGVPDTQVVAAVVAPTAVAGFDRLRTALEVVRIEFPDARLRVITSVAPGERQPDWIEIVPGGRPALAGLLADARVCVIPLPLTRYTEFAVPVRLADLVAFGKPIVVTDSAATRDFLGESGAALLSDDTPAALAAAIGTILRDDALANALGSRARAFAELRSSTWGGRAVTVLTSLLGSAAVTAGTP